MSGLTAKEASKKSQLWKEEQCSDEDLMDITTVRQA